MFINTESHCMALLIAVLQSRGGISRGISFSKSIHQPHAFKKRRKEGKQIPSPSPTTKTEGENKDLKQSRFQTAASAVITENIIDFSGRCYELPANPEAL